MEAAGREAANAAIVRPNAETTAGLVGAFDFSTQRCLSQVVFDLAGICHREHTIYEGHGFIMHCVKGWTCANKMGSVETGNRREVQ